MLPKNNKKSKKVVESESDDDSTHISSVDENEENEDIDDMTVDDISKEATDNFKKNELLDHIIKYVQIDNLIRDKRKEIREDIKVLNDRKKRMEVFILKYLDDINQEQVNIDGTGKLKKNVSQVKGAIKIDNIKKSIEDGIKKEGIIKDDKRLSVLLESILDLIDKNRPVTKRVYLKRIAERKKKDTIKNHLKSAKKDKADIIENNDIESDVEEIPKYESKEKGKSNKKK
jgi:hypothetical protein